MEFIIIGVVTAFNLLVIVKKVNKKRYEDAILDTSLFVVVVLLFSGSYAGMVVSMIASLIVSIYLYRNPPTFFKKAVNDPANVNQFRDILNEIKNFDPSKPPKRPH